MHLKRPALHFLVRKMKELRNCIIETRRKMEYVWSSDLRRNCQLRTLHHDLLTRSPPISEKENTWLLETACAHGILSEPLFLLFHGYSETQMAEDKSQLIWSSSLENRCRHPARIYQEARATLKALLMEDPTANTNIIQHNT